jgi:hypothetical protein
MIDVDIPRLVSTIDVSLDGAPFRRRLSGSA